MAWPERPNPVTGVPEAGVDDALGVAAGVAAGMGAVLPARSTTVSADSSLLKLELPSGMEWACATGTSP